MTGFSLVLTEHLSVSATENVYSRRASETYYKLLVLSVRGN